MTIPESSLYPDTPKPAFLKMRYGPWRKCEECMGAGDIILYFDGISDAKKICQNCKGRGSARQEIWG